MRQVQVYLMMLLNSIFNVLFRHNDWRMRILTTIMIYDITVRKLIAISILPEYIYIYIYIYIYVYCNRTSCAQVHELP